MKARPFEPVDLDLINGDEKGFMDMVVASQNMNVESEY